MANQNEKWFVYILLCNDNSMYTGYSNDIEKRFEDHKNGKGAKYTKSHKPLEIIYYERLNSKSDALKREWEIKGWTRAKKLKELKLII